MALILVVDDDEDILRLMQFALGQAGHQISLALDGPQGLETIRKTPPDLIIADIMMPEMTGYEFTEQVRNNLGLKDIPIIIYSARFQPIDKQTALDAGATDYIPKTLSPSDIVKHVNTLLEEASAAEAEVAAQTGKTLAFFSLRGGTGVTTLAVNVAVTLALNSRSQIALTDLNPVAGHSGLFLNLRPKKNLHQLLSQETPISEEVVKSYLSPHSSGVQLLASPLLPPSQTGSKNIVPVLQQLAALFKASIIDLPHATNDILIDLLPAFDKLVLVLSPDVPSLQSAAVALQMLAKYDVNSESIVPVLNRNTPVPGLAAQTIEKTLRRPLAAEIPFESKMIAAINSGKPLITSDLASPTTKAIAKLAGFLTK